MKISKQIILCLALTGLLSCGEKKDQRVIVSTDVKDTVKPVAVSEIKSNDPKMPLIIQTKDVKGEITTPGKADTLLLHISTSDGKLIIPVIKLDTNAAVQIYPTKKDFAMLMSELNRKIKLQGKVETIDERKYGWFYKITNNHHETSYNFIVYKAGNKNYELTGQGYSNMNDITDEQSAAKAYNVALSFVPEKK